MNRRHVLATAVLTLSAAVVGFSAEDSPRPTPREALGQLKAGNDRFARNASKPASLSVNRRREPSGTQSPSTMILSCADSRIPPELVFNTGLGALFVVRTSGGVVDRSVLATIEYGAGRLRIPNLDYLYDPVSRGSATARDGGARRTRAGSAGALTRVTRTPGRGISPAIRVARASAAPSQPHRHPSSHVLRAGSRACTNPSGDFRT
jgi:hypothetical protein